MHAAERERLVQMYSAGDSSKAVPICAGCLALLALVVVTGSSKADDFAQSPRPTVIAAAQATPAGSRSEQHRKQTFEARRVASTDRR